MHRISPVAGWALDYIVALDTHRRGTAGDFLRASAERRQVVGALLSSKPFPSDPCEANELAALTSEGGHRDILAAAYGNVPVGLRRALSRSGSQTHPRSFYKQLHDILAVAGESSIAHAIRHLDTLDLMRLRIAQTLPGDVCTADFIKLIGSVRTATDVAQLINLMTKAGVDEIASRVPASDRFLGLRNERPERNAQVVVEDELFSLED